jgi:glycosyltransferase involved in cell wall biosynthesis
MANPLKVLQFVRGSERYGASVSIRNLCYELRARGHEVVPVLYEGRGLGGDFADDFEVIELSPHGKFSPSGILQIRDLIRKVKPDLVHAHLSAATLSGSFAARFAGTPVIATVHGMNSRWTYSFANRLITVSEAAKKHLVRQGISASKISVAYNGIAAPASDTSKRAEMRTNLGIQPDALVLGSISRADYGKGIQDAVAAVAMVARRHPNVHYVFAGEGECLENLKLQAKTLALGDRAQFLGYRTDVFDVLSAMDLLLFPSLKEAMGISIIEAMAMGLPVIGTEAGGIPEVIDEASGMLVPPNNAPALAEAIDCMLSDLDQMRAMGAAAKKRAGEKFSLAASAGMVEDAYARLLRR